MVGLALRNAATISSGLSWVNTTTTATMTSSMVSMDRQENRASVTDSGTSFCSSSAMAVMEVCSVFSSCLSQESRARVGEGMATFCRKGAICRSVCSPQTSRAALKASSTPISAANRASSCTLSSAILAPDDPLSPLCQPAITGMPPSSRASVSGVIRRCV